MPIVLLAGLRRLQSTLNPKAPEQDVEAESQPAILASGRAALPAQPASVTEGTTGLMETSEPVSVSVRQGKNTDPILDSLPILALFLESFLRHRLLTPRKFGSGLFDKGRRYSLLSPVSREIGQVFEAPLVP